MDRRTKGKEREERVVAAAGQAISELGFANVRVADIAERADMTTGHVSYYFPSKNDLLLLAIRRSEEGLLLETRAALAEIDRPIARLDALIELAAARGFQDDGWQLWLQVWADGLSDADVSSEHRQLDQRWFDVLVEVIEYGRDRGVFDVADPIAAAEMLSAMIDGLSVQVTVGSPRVDRDRMLALCRSASATLLGFVR